MKKTTLTIAASIGLTLGAFGQGSLLLNTPQNPVVDVGSTNIGTATGYYSGSFTLEVFYALPTQTSTNEAKAINLSWASSSAALALLGADGDFTQEFLGGAGNQSSTNQTITGGNAGDFNFNSVALNNIPTSGLGVFVLVGIGTGGLEGLVAFANATGGNLGVSPAGTPAQLTGWNGGSLAPGIMNMDLTPVPEPATLALAGLGGLSMLLFRRRNK